MCEAPLRQGHPMTDFEALVREWQPRMGLGDWHIRVVIGPIKGGHRATCEAMPEYPEMVLSFDPEAMAKAGDDPIAQVQHEAAHGFPWELAQEALELCDLLYRNDGKARGAAKRRVGRYEERCTSLIQRALKAAYEAGKAER